MIVAHDNRFAPIVEFAWICWIFFSCCIFGPFTVRYKLTLYCCSIGVNAELIYLSHENERKIPNNKCGAEEYIYIYMYQYLWYKFLGHSSFLKYRCFLDNKNDLDGLFVYLFAVGIFRTFTMRVVLLLQRNNSEVGLITSWTHDRKSLEETMKKLLICKR